MLETNQAISSPTLRGIYKLNLEKPFHTVEDTFDFVTKDQSISLSKNKKVA